MVEEKIKTKVEEQKMETKVEENKDKKDTKKENVTQEKTMSGSVRRPRSRDRPP